MASLSNGDILKRVFASDADVPPIAKRQWLTTKEERKVEVWCTILPFEHQNH